MKNINLPTVAKTLVVTLTILMTTFAITSSCTKNEAQEMQPEATDDTTVTVENVTYNNFAKALFETRCRSCHGQGASASTRWTFSDITSIRNHVDRINNVVIVTKSMPLGNPLTTRELQLLAGWFARNTPEN